MLCVCVRERVCVCERLCYVCVLESMCVCERECVCVRERECVSVVCVRECERRESLAPRDAIGLC